MRLLWAFSTFALGGPQRRFAVLAEALGETYEHVITAMDGRYDAEQIIAAGVRRRRADLPVVKSGFVSLQNVATFRRLLVAERPDLLLTSNWGTLEWFLANRGRERVPHIHFEDGFGPDEVHGGRRKKRDLARLVVFSRAISPAASFVAPSRTIERIFTGPWGVSSERVHRIPNGVDVERFIGHPPAGRDAVVVGTVAALRAEKRIDRLLRIFAAAAVDDARLLIVGDGAERASLESLADSLGVGDRTEFAGARDDVLPLLRRMDVFALTSDTEQMPISLIEAMAAGLPVVAADVGDVAEIVAAENRPFIHPPADESSLAAALKKLAADAALREKLGASNTAKARREYGLARMTERYRRLFDMVTAGVP